MVDMTKLLPCPFCGGDATILALPGNDRFPATLHQPRCRSCGADLGGHGTRDKARSAWNTRTTPEPTTAALEAAREALETIVDLERHTRSGGATHDDLASYEEGLDTAIEIAAAALAALAAITKAQGVGRGMSADRYYARSASDRTNDWPFWFVADKSRGGLNVTAELIRQYSYEPINRMAPVPILLSKKLARRLVEHIKEMQHAV